MGRVLKRLDDLERRENTIVVFFSDNGPNSFRFNGGMKGRKGSVDEGGLRSPCFMRFPNSVPAGRRTDIVLGAIDLLPTLAELCDLEPRLDKPLDGRSFAALITERDANWPERLLLSVWADKYSIRSQQFRLDDQGRLFDIAADRGQRKDVSDQHPQQTAALRQALAQFRREMQPEFQRYADRPFTVGYAASTTLPARDGVPHGEIERSSKAPNNSFFENWTGRDASITWDIDVGREGTYEATVNYTCQDENVGATVRLSAEQAGSAVEQAVSGPFDPPLYDKTKERVEQSHYFVKDFQPLVLGTLELQAGHDRLRLAAPKIVGDQVIDVHSIELKRLAP